MADVSVPDLSFAIEKAAPARFCAVPQLDFALAITDTAPRSIHAVALRCQIRLEPARRTYKAPEKPRLKDLFGEPARWGQTMRTMLWANTTAVVPPFNGATKVELPVPCTYDLNVAAAKYFYALEDGEVPICFLFSGTIFYAAEDQHLQVCQIPWDKETNFRLPVNVWRQMMDSFYPNTAWLALRKDAFDDLYDFKIRNALPTWEAVVERLMEKEPRQQVTG